VILITIWWLQKLGKEERLAVSKQAAQKFDMERFNFRKLNVTTSPKKRLGLYELKKHKLWFNE
jgi:cell division inhibitor SulA